MHSRATYGRRSHTYSSFSLKSSRHRKHQFTCTCIGASGQSGKMCTVEQRVLLLPAGPLREAQTKSAVHKQLIVSQSCVWAETGMSGRGCLTLLLFSPSLPPSLTPWPPFQHVWPVCQLQQYMEPEDGPIDTHMIGPSQNSQRPLHRSLCRLSFWLLGCLIHAFGCVLCRHADTGTRPLTKTHNTFHQPASEV